MALATTTIQGTIQQFIYRDDETGFIIAKVKLEDGTELKVKGTVPNATPGITYRFSGIPSTDKFGEIFNIDTYDRERPKSAAGIESYLKTLPGCGATSASKIVREFGEKSLDVLRETPEGIAKLPRITTKRATEMQTALMEREASTNQEVELRTILQGIASHIIGKSFARWGSGATDTIKADPYRLTELRGVGFDTADTVARQMGMPFEDPRRIAAGCIYTAKDYRKAGHVVFAYDTFILDVMRKLGMGDHADYRGAITGFLNGPLAGDSWKVWRGNNAMMMLGDWSAEMEVSEWVAGRCKATGVPMPEGIVGTLLNGLKEDQMKAFYAALYNLAANDIFILTGPPGTGKTFLVNRILDHYESKDKLIQLMAPTGKAAQRLREMTGRDATTIHRGLETKVEKGVFTFNRDASNPLTVDLVIVDETSMVDLHLFKSLTRAITGNTGLLLVGDPYQLPSVGPGCVLRDLIAAGVPTVELTEIKRQNPGGIVQVCHQMVRREPPSFELFNGTDLYMINCPSVDAIGPMLVDLAYERLPTWLTRTGQRTNDQMLQDVQILSPRRTKHKLGTDELNPILRDHLVAKGLVNPTEDRAFGTGERIIQTSNDYNLNVFNGDTGTIVGVVKSKQHGTWCYRVVWDAGGETEIPTKAHSLQLAYALTIHKSQGSEWPVVIIPVHSTFDFNFDRPLLYTAISRATKMCVIVGRFRDFSNIAQKAGSITRNTGLAGQIKHRLEN